MKLYGLIIFLFTINATAAKELVFERINRAILTGEFSQVKELLKDKKDFDEPINDDETILMLAASEGRLDVVKWLHRNNADINSSTKEGHRALSYAILGGHSEMAGWLIKQGASVNFVHEKSELNPLFDAITVNDLATIKLILSKSPQLIGSTAIETETQKKYSPVQWAQRFGQIEIAEFLASQLAAKKRFK